MNTKVLKEGFVITAEKKNLALLRESVSEFLKKAGFPEMEINKIVLALDEATTNIVEHGYNFNPDAEIEIDLEADEEKFTAVLKDSAARFDPREAPTVDLASHIKAGKKKGLGIFLIRQIVDELKYIYENGQNMLTIIKYRPDFKKGDKCQH